MYSFPSLQVFLSLSNWILICWWFQLQVSFQQKNLYSHFQINFNLPSFQFPLHVHLPCLLPLLQIRSFSPQESWEWWTWQKWGLFWIALQCCVLSCGLFSFHQSYFPTMKITRTDSCLQFSSFEWKTFFFFFLVWKVKNFMLKVLTFPLSDLFFVELGRKKIVAFWNKNERRNFRRNAYWGSLIPNVLYFWALFLKRLLIKEEEFPF